MQQDGTPGTCNGDGPRGDGIAEGCRMEGKVVTGRHGKSPAGAPSGRRLRGASSGTGSGGSRWPPLLAHGRAPQPPLHSTALGGDTPAVTALPLPHAPQPRPLPRLAGWRGGGGAAGGSSAQPASCICIPHSASHTSHPALRIPLPACRSPAAAAPLHKAAAPGGSAGRSPCPNRPPGPGPPLSELCGTAGPPPAPAPAPLPAPHPPGSARRGAVRCGSGPPRPPPA